jgi:hypothetical protein
MAVAAGVSGETWRIRCAVPLVGFGGWLLLGPAKGSSAPSTARSDLE